MTTKDLVHQCILALVEKDPAAATKEALGLLLFEETLQRVDGVLALIAAKAAEDTEIAKAREAREEGLALSVEIREKQRHVAEQARDAAREAREQELHEQRMSERRPRNGKNAQI